MTSAITVGTRSEVATEHLSRLAARLQFASSECSEISARLPRLRTDDAVGRSADLADIERGIRRARDRFDELTNALRTAVSLYTEVERTAARAVEAVIAQLAAAAGFLAARLGVVLLPALVNAAVATAAVWALLPESMRERVVEGASTTLEHALPAVSDQSLVDSIRIALSMVDDATLGALGVPPSLVAALGESGLGVVRVDSAALVVLGLAALAGSTGVDPVRVTMVGADRRRGEGFDPAAPPTSLADRVARIPDATTPIVIERFPNPAGGWHYEVYIAGTDSKAALGGDRPWDMLSNIALVAEQRASSLQAVHAAMRAAGIESSSSVVFTGYSQGGAIATALAESGEWSTAGLVTVGAPTGGMPATGSYPAIVIEHREDLVPVLSGIRRETAAVIVRGDAFSSGPAGDSALPAHEIERYRATAAAADAHDHDALRSAIDALPQITSTGERMAFTAVRVPANSG
ncbi:MAG: hypothetical protein KIT89_09955 [Microcella sp.]|uniref:hypothetical protein n=1 Tax=Microcella sp. TaxID=1913979 RepID=UPI0024C81AF9|nr:hypothetical protein [Microcella sp.]UYN83023.1 MAG: hypothetical protein KIT89_09955 [Microcella sp.]